MMYPVFARVKYYNYDTTEDKTDDIWFLAENFADAAKKIENYYEADLVGFSIYLFEESPFIFQEELPKMKLEAKKALGIF